jgi:fucose 4-O-acetylase-like acetyltransferase
MMCENSTSVSEVARARHNSQISIAKAIGIILMVAGHSGCPEYVHDFIYLFHMPLFFFLSAYFFRDEKVTVHCGQFVMRKFKNLYWPYIKWSFVFLLLHNVFYIIGFYDSSLTWQNILVNAKRSVLGMWQGEKILGAYWFLISLFWESMLFAAIIWMKHKVRSNYFDIIAVVGLFFIGYYSSVDLLINREMVLLPVFYMGYLTARRQVDLSATRRLVLVAALLSLPILAMMAAYTKIEVGQSVFGNPAIFLTGSFMGVYLVMIISAKLDHTLMGKWLDLVGGATMSVLTFHFLSFKILTWLLVFLGIYSPSVLSQWPVPTGHAYNNLWWLYTIVGVMVPIFCGSLIKKFQSRHV